MTLDEQIDDGVTSLLSIGDYAIDYDKKVYASLKQLHLAMDINMTTCNFTAKYRNLLVSRHKQHALALAISLTTLCSTVKAQADAIIKRYTAVEQTLYKRWVK